MAENYHWYDSPTAGIGNATTAASAQVTVSSSRPQADVQMTVPLTSVPSLGTSRRVTFDFNGWPVAAGGDVLYGVRFRVDPDGAPQMLIATAVTLANADGSQLLTLSRVFPDDTIVQPASRMDIDFTDWTVASQIGDHLSVNDQATVVSSTADSYAGTVDMNWSRVQ